MKLSSESTYLILNNDPLPIIGWSRDHVLCYYNDKARECFNLIKEDIGSPVSKLKGLDGSPLSVQTLAEGVTLAKYQMPISNLGNDLDMALKIHQNKLYLLSEVAAGLAHEINNPLGIISLSISIVEDQVMKVKESLGEGHDKILSYIANVDNAIERTKEIIQKLVLFAKDESIDVVAEISVENFIRNSLVFCKNRIKNLQVQVEENFEKDFKFKTKIAPLMQAYVSVLYNAIESFEGDVKEDAKISLISFHDEKNCYLQIKNNGNDLNEKCLVTLLAPFYTHKKGHLGNGLTVANHLIEKIGGKLELSDDGDFTTFTITIPRT